MRLRVKLFALLKDKAGAAEVELELPQGARAGDVLAQLGRAHPELAAHLPHCRLALNHEFASPEEPVLEGAEAAVIPPVSGG